jgi:hypothetical protein
MTLNNTIPTSRNGRTLDFILFFASSSRGFCERSKRPARSNFGWPKACDSCAYQFTKTFRDLSACEILVANAARPGDLESVNLLKVNDIHLAPGLP